MLHQMLRDRSGRISLNWVFNLLMCGALIYFFFRFQGTLERVILGAAIVLNLLMFLNTYLAQRRVRRSDQVRK